MADEWVHAMFGVNYDNNYDNMMNRVIDHINYSGTDGSDGVANDDNGGVNVVAMMRMIPVELVMMMTMLMIVMKTKMEIVLMTRMDRFGSESLIVKNYCYAPLVLYTCIILLMCIRNLV